MVWWQRRVEAPIRIVDVNVLNYDTFAYYYPMLRYAFGHLRRGDLPLWNPWQLCGTPFFATAQHLLLYPLNLPYLVLSTPAAMKASAILHLTLGVVFTTVLARVLGLSVGAGLTAGFAFVLGGSIAGLVYLPHHLYGVVWLPLHLALTHLVLVRPRRRWWAVALGIALACQYLGGYPMYSLLSAYVLGAYVAMWLAGAVVRGERFAAPLGALAGAGAVAAILAAPQLLPAAELAGLSPRHALTLEGVDPPALRRFFTPAALLRHVIVPTLGAVTPAPGHVGIAALVLAVLGVSHRRRRAHAVFFLVLAVGAWLLAFGSRTPVYRLYFALPTGDWFRIPVRFLTLASFAVAMLAGFGTDVLAGGGGRAGRPPVVVALTAAVAVGVALVASRILAPFELRRLAIVLGGVCAAVVSLVLAPSPFRGVFVPAIPLVVYAELYLAFANGVALPETHPDLYTLPPGVVDFLHEHQGYDRTYVPLRGDELIDGPSRLPSKAGMLHGLYLVGDRENLYPARWADYVAYMERGEPPNPVYLSQGEVMATPESAHPRLLDLMSARWIVVGDDVRDAWAGVPQFVRQYRGEGVTIYENRAAVPRAFVVHRAEVISDPRRVLARLATSDFDPLSTVVLEEPVDVPPGPAAAFDARITRYTAEAIDIETITAAPGLLTLTDQHYPGWHATVDGTPTPIQRANYLFRAIQLPPGTHRVEFRFSVTAR